jgi:uroporphyrinogen III methyltransferase/synthase
MENKVYLVGCGLRKEHLTIEALNAISEADIILYDRLIDKNILKINKKAKKIYVGKKPGESKKQNNINQLFLKYKNKIITRLHAGDPFIFGRGYEEYLFLKNKKIKVEIIPGISTFQVLEKLKIPITYRKTSSSVALITGSRADKTANYTGICADTLIFYMPMLNLKNIIKRLKHKGKHLNSDFILIENAFKENYRIINGNIDNILELAREAQVEAPSLLVIGKIKRKLQRNNILLFRQKENEKQTKKLLNKFNIINMPLIKIQHKKINNIPKNKIYAFTSPNSVKSVFSQLKLNGKFVAIGDITKKTIKKYGKKAFVPKIQTSNGLMDYLKRFRKKDVFVFCSQNTNVKGYRKIYCYNTAYLKNKSIKKSINEVDTIFPTSSEILNHLVKIIPITELNKKTIVVIGPRVALEAKKLGMHIDFMLEKPDIGALNDLL